MGRKRSASEARNGTQKPAHTTPKGPQERKQMKDHASKAIKTGQKDALIFQPRPDWHATELPPLPTVEAASQPPRHILDEVHNYGRILLESENTSYGASHLSSSSSNKFLTTIMASGTLEDKVSALTLLVQESPLHTMKAFENLLGLARKKGRNQALMALGALKDLLGQGVVLPPDRKLRAFVRQPGLIAAFQGIDSWTSGNKLPGALQRVHLVVWAYEDWLKRTYFELLKVLEGWCNDEIEYARSRAVTFVWELLKEKPEQEENLLRLLINKLGDTNKKIASRASYLLLQLQVTHPLMKGVVVNAIESELLFRPGQSAHAKYYAIITLNQTILSIKEQEVANKLLDIYFSLFINLLKKPEQAQVNTNAKGHAQGGGGKAGKQARHKAKQKDNANKAEEELHEKMIAQVLTGVNRAFPFAKTDDATFESQLDTIFRITHSSNFNTSIQALTLIQQISATKHYSADRFYRTLYESLFDPRLLTSSKQILYLNLLYRALKSDISTKRVKAFVKRLLQIVTLHEPAFVCGVLYLISELQTTFPSIKGMLDQPEDVGDDEEERFVDVPEEGEAAASAAADNAESIKPTFYDGRKRDPEHSNADKSCLWELTPFQAHFHPSVSLFASHLLHSEKMPPKPDPTMHTLIHFLDRFAYRNAKSKPASTRGISLMQPLAGGAAAGDRLLTARDAGKGQLPVNSEAFWKRRSEQVAPDEVFFHNYFNQTSKRKAADKKAEKVRQGVAKGEDEDEEEEVWKALVNSRPEIEADDDEDEEGFEDMEDLMSDVVDADDDAEVEEALVEDEGEEDEGQDAADASDAGFDAADLEDGDEALLGSDEELPSDVDGALVGQEESEEEQEEASKRKKGKGEDRGEKRRKLRHLPTFASAEDYARLLDQEDDEE